MGIALHDHSAIITFQVVDAQNLAEFHQEARN